MRVDSAVNVRAGPGGWHVDAKAWSGTSGQPQTSSPLVIDKQASAVTSPNGRPKGFTKEIIRHSGNADADVSRDALAQAVTGEDAILRGQLDFQFPSLRRVGQLRRQIRGTLGARCNRSMVAVDGVI